MTKLTIEVNEDIVHSLEVEAASRQLTVEAIAAERVAHRWHRYGKPTPPQLATRTDDPESIIGAFSDVPNFVETMEEIIADRARRYAPTP